jgi:hypothetical protein
MWPSGILGGISDEPDEMQECWKPFGREIKHLPLLLHNYFEYPTGRAAGHLRQQLVQNADLYSLNAFFDPYPGMSCVRVGCWEFPSTLSISSRQTHLLFRLREIM